MFKKNPHVVEKLFAVLVEDLQKLFTEGFEVNGVRYWAACKACKGDMDFFYKYFNLERCYTKIMARSRGYLCHECLASGGANSQMPFEDIGDDPRWVASMFTSRPWSSEPQLAGVPYDLQAPEGLLKYDLFHVVKLGLARDVVGGVICTLARKGFFDFEGSTRAFTDRLQGAHSWFLMFCTANKLKPSCRSFTKAFFNIKNMLSSPFANCKGADSMILLKFCKWFVSLNLNEARVAGFASHAPQLPWTCLLWFTPTCKLFLERDCASRLYVNSMRLLRGIRLLGKLCSEMRVREFNLKPKGHALHHIAHSLKTQLEGGSALILNPEATACEVNEDFVGRVSRLSRRVNIRVCDLRVSSRIFLKTRALLKRRAEEKR